MVIENLDINAPLPKLSPKTVPLNKLLEIYKGNGPDHRLAYNIV
ncbi:hypothetical protein C2W64_02166 [Brevibacillus laterosporus]|nr:hypothetical protein C2W64_02166 [Brevibacillus laterosporus]